MQKKVQLDNKFCSLKKIKRLNFRSLKKKEIKEQEESSPSKFLDPINFFVIFSDLVIYDNLDRIPEPFISPLKSLVSLKFLVSIDSFDKYLLVNFDEKSVYSTTPLPLLLTRLRSLNNEKAFELSNKIENYHNFWEMNVKIQQTSGDKQTLDSINEHLLRILRKYYHERLKASIEEQDFPDFLRVYLEERQKRAMFCLIYSQCDLHSGTSITGFLINDCLKKLISKSQDFDFSKLDFIYLSKEKYFDTYLQTLDVYLEVKPGDSFEFFIKTKEGYRKMRFQIERWYLNLKKGGKKILVFFSEIKTGDNEILPLINHPKEQSGKGVLKYQTQWKKLVGLYFARFSEKQG